MENSGSSVPSASNREVVLLAGGTGRAAELTRAYARFDFATRVAPVYAEASQILDHSRVRLLLVDLDTVESERVHGLELMARVHGQFPALPIFVISDRDSTVDRVEVSRFGGRGFFRPDRSASDIAEATIEHLRLTDRRARILAVDDDPAVLDALAATLEDASVRKLGESTEIMQVVAEWNPDLVILDLEMPGANGLEICRALRMDERTENLPVIILTSHTSDETIAKVFEAGADDYVRKPFIAAELVARVGGRISRARMARRVTELDPLTGCLNRASFSERFRRHPAVEGGEETTVALLRFELRQRDELIRTLGPEAVESAMVLIANHLTEADNGSELIGRWDETTLVMTLSGLDRNDAVAWATPVLRTICDSLPAGASELSSRPCVSLAVAEYPSDGTEAEVLVGVADRVAQAAWNAGVRSAITSDWNAEEEGIELVDVAIVDDDEAVTTLLRETLESWQYRVATIPNGLEALERLTGSETNLRARVVLLDVDMPKMDGHTLLRRLASAGVLADTRVIMLTVRGTDREALASMRMGAFDHMTKPFSIPLLLERIRRALDS